LTIIFYHIQEQKSSGNVAQIMGKLVVRFLVVLPIDKISEM
jgi:hypothetical protein